MVLPPSSTFLLLLIATAMAADAAGDSVFRLKPKRKSHLHFYMHDINVSGPNATAIKMVPNPANASLFTFGVITAIDNATTEGPSMTTSMLTGLAQGLTPEGFNLLWTVMNLVFVEGKYKGSTLAIMGMDDALAAVRTLPIFGGTGRFRSAVGFVKLKTHAVVSGDVILELDVYVVH